ncbi:tethering complex subunit PEP3 KNAG_0A02800 [Huiozyma naganishii CBS 8797]|uniref:Uncharacterized protein n=1 Tax=Huiozyma naganishii (strain ATCC MYA-139 / BCRC 22969 / CBS 8797 / KCTC 17520 / NBRC 10181 / NCYC 3082 / Yp74L-3) TaxID=1071383 RepID=J7S255_HUIN7|nr:hypothetical protein KNAG_0A02800 [Kazachstania naganishii CBS 8797]CCK67969.1 hypothetical protein KNAG_0A02800 [Kazachstania naganishii CBS 8797]
MEVTIEHVQLDFVRDRQQRLGHIASLNVCNDIFVFGLKTGQIYAIDLDVPSKVSSFNVPLVEGSEKLLALWVDAGASQCVVKTNFAKYYVLSVQDIIQGQGKTPGQGRGLVPLRKLVKQKHCDVRVVFWLDETKFICSTTKGDIFLIDMQTSDPSCTLLTNLDSAIDGLVYDRQRGRMIVAMSHTLMYWDIKDKDLSPVEVLQRGIPPTEQEKFEPLQYDSRRTFVFKGSKFAWVTDAGIIYGDLAQEGFDQGNKLGSLKMILSMELPDSPHHIKDLTISDYHVFILRGPTVLIINQLSNKVVFNETIYNDENQPEKIVGLTVDQTQSTFWCFSSRNVYEIILKGESKAVWKLLCEQGEYGEALALKDLNSWEYDYIQYQRGTAFMKNSDLLSAAKCFSECSSTSIGSMVLQLMQDSGDDSQDTTTAVQALLTNKLDKIMHSRDRVVPQILLSSWITWNFMNQMNKKDELMNTEKDQEKLTQLRDDISILKADFQSFLKRYLPCLDNDTVYQIILNQNRKAELLYFANLVNDVDYVISYWISQENWYESLKALQSSSSDESLYKYSNILLINAPEATVATWMKFKAADPVKLIPSMLTYFTKYQKSVMNQGTNVAFTYLEWYIDKFKPKEPIIYNTASYMLITGAGRDAVDTDKVIDLLEKLESKFDSHFVLRLSLKYKQTAISIHLFTQMKFFKEAMDLCLAKNRIDLAKKMLTNEDLAQDPAELKSLWLQLSKKLLYTDKNLENSQAIDVKQTIRSIIQESNGVIEIKDLLPIFDEFTTIANIKDELIKSLDDHSKSMQQISQDIRKWLHMKDEMQTDIEKFRERYQILEPGVSCDSCHRILQTRKFLVFPCGHCFHNDCLIKKILLSNDFMLKSQIENFQKRLARDKKYGQLTELESLMTTKCCLCSDLNINTLDNLVTVNQADIEKWSL